METPLFNAGTGLYEIEESSLSSLTVDNLTINNQIDMSNHKIVNLAMATNAGDATSKAYVDSVAGLSPWNVSGSDLFYSAGRVGIGSSTFTGASVLQVTGASYLNGAVDVNGNIISNVHSPTASGDAANKSYVDNKSYPLSTILAAGNDANSYEISNIAALGMLSTPPAVTTGKIYISGGKVFYNGTEVGSVPTLAAVLGISNSAGSYNINMNSNEILSAFALQLSNNIPATVTNKLYNNAGVLYFNGTAVGVAQSLASTLAIGNSAGSYGINMNNQTITNCSSLSMTGSINAAGYYIYSSALSSGTNANLNLAANGSGITSIGNSSGGGKIIVDPTYNTVSIGNTLTPSGGYGYGLYTESILCSGVNVIASNFGYYLNNQIFKPVEWDWFGSSKASISSNYYVQWDSVLDSLPSMDLAWDWELEIRFRNYATTTDYIGILYNGQTAGSVPTIYGYYGHEVKQYAGSATPQAFVNNHCFSKVLNRNVDYQDQIYRLRLCWDSRNNVLVNYTKGVCYRWGNGAGATITDYTQDEGAQVYSNTSYLQEVSGVTPIITSIRFQSYTTTINIFRSATLRVKRVAKRWT